jgi:hypothetical protein
MKATKKKPRATAGLKLNERMKKDPTGQGPDPQGLSQVLSCIATPLGPMLNVLDSAYLLGRRCNDKSPLRLARHDSRNSHRAETERGLRRIGQPSVDEGGANTPCPGSPGPNAAAQPMLGSCPEPHHLSSNAG